MDGDARGLIEFIFVLAYLICDRRSDTASILLSFAYYGEPAKESSRFSSSTSCTTLGIL